MRSWTRFVRVRIGRRAGAPILACALAGIAAWASLADARKVRYSAGPQPQPDTVLATAQIEIDEIVRSRGPRVPATNLQLTSLVANRAFERALVGLPASHDQVLVAPAEDHPLNFVAEHAVLRELSKRGTIARVRRSPVVDDSLALVASNPGHPVLEYQLASARVTYLRLVGWLPGRVKVERQALVEGRLTLRDPTSARVLWTGDATDNLVDVFPRGQIPLVEDERFAELKGVMPERAVNKAIEPVVVVAVVAGLVALFFENRP